MKKSGLLFVIIIIMCFQYGLSKELLSNGDFEYGDGGWNLWIFPEVSDKVKAKAEIKSDFGENSSNGAKIELKMISDKNWHVQFQAPDWVSKKNKWYELEFSAKSPDSAIIHAAIQGGAPSWEYVSGMDCYTTNEWSKFKVKFKAHREGYKQIKINFYLNTVGTYYFDNVKINEIDNFDDSWYENAEQRIDSLRKGDFEVILQDTAGKILANQEVEVELIRHAFDFGTALALSTFEEGSDTEKWYLETANDLFWYGVPENDFKWPNYERQKNKTNEKTFDRYRKFAKEYNWEMRAHALEWGIEKYNFDKFWARQKGCDYYKKHLKKRIERDVAKYKGFFPEYDVWNESFHEKAIFEKCGEDLLDSAFVWAHRVDSKARLYMNEYSVVAGGETETYFRQIKGLQDRKVPVHGIGVQCHFSGGIIEPSFIKDRLDRLSELKLPIKITEFDIGNQTSGLGISEEDQADLFEKFIRIVFSHPSVDAIVLWGFWDSRHWIKNGGIVREDRSYKPAAERIKKLWNETWTTKLKLKTDNQGKIKFRGFYGDYKFKIAGFEIKHDFK